MPTSNITFCVQARQLAAAHAYKDYQPMQTAYYQIPGVPMKGGFKPIEFEISRGELSKIDLRIGELFENQKLSVLYYVPLLCFFCFSFT